MADREKIDPDAVRSLWTAVLARAVEDYRYKGASKESLAYRKDARQWANCDAYKGIGSFSYVCEALDLEPEAVLDRLKRGDG